MLGKAAPRSGCTTAFTESPPLWVQAGPQRKKEAIPARPSCGAGGEIRARRRAEGEKPDLFFSHRKRVLRSNGNVGSQIAGSSCGPEAGKKITFEAEFYTERVEP